MVRLVLFLVCAVSVFLVPAFAQTAALEPLRYPSGAVLDFHLHTRFNPVVENDADLLPTGTLLRVKLLSPIDSATARDGSEIRGVVTVAVLSGDKIVVHADAEAQVVFVVLRSRTHPQGFRYELLVTKVIDAGRSLDLTASLDPSFADSAAPSPDRSKPAGAPTARAAGSDALTKHAGKGAY